MADANVSVSRLCTKCGTTKPPSEFRGKRYKCKECSSTDSRDWYRRNPGKKVEHLQRGGGSATKRNRHHRYGLSTEQYGEMVSRQNGECAICKTPAENAPHGKLCIDHCHDTGAIRGLLCQRCNTGLGMFRDNLERLEVAVAYMREPPVKEIFIPRQRAVPPPAQPLLPTEKR